MINYEYLPIILDNKRFCIKTDNGQKVPLFSIRAFTYKYDTYDDFPFEGGWCRFTLYANIDNYFDENLANDMFCEHIFEQYQHSVRLRIYEKKNFFLNKKKWFNYFYKIAEAQVDYFLKNQKFLFEFKLLQKENINNIRYENLLGR